MKQIFGEVRLRRLMRRQSHTLGAAATLTMDFAYASQLPRGSTSIGITLARKCLSAHGTEHSDSFCTWLLTSPSTTAPLVHGLTTDVEQFGDLCGVFTTLS